MLALLTCILYILSHSSITGRNIPFNLSKLRPTVHPHCIPHLLACPEKLNLSGPTPLLLSSEEFAGFEFQRCTSMRLERGVRLGCRGHVSADTYFADHPNCSHACLAGWNVLSMGVSISQDQDTCMTFSPLGPVGTVTPL